ncbi:MAG: hypothetical protein FWD65_05420, partial [Coriobacteriia bacterium]|nr:hypothetical protein [Coriobacteriia bacterium]
WKVTVGGSSAAVLGRGANPAYADLAADDQTSAITLQAQWDLAPYDVTVKYYLSDKPGSPVGTKVLSGQLFDSSIALDSALLNAYKPAHGYSDGTSPAAPAYTVIDGTNTITVTYVQIDFTITILFHALDGSGVVIGQTEVDPAYGDVIDSTPYLNKFKPAVGYGDGVAVDTPWVVTDTPGGNVFNVYYPNTAPVVHVVRDVLYLRRPTKLTPAEILSMTGAVATDAEEGPIPSSKIKMDGYGAIPWTVPNFPSQDGYQVVLSVKDTPGLMSPVMTISIFIESESEPVTPLSPKDPRYKDLPKPPAGKAWGIDGYGHLVLYTLIVTPGSSRTKSGLKTGRLLLGALPATGDSLVLIAPTSLLALAAASGAGALIVARRKRRRESAVAVPRPSHSGD